MADHINDPKLSWQITLMIRSIGASAQARVHAEQITDPESKTTMLKIGEDYEKLAQRAEQRLQHST
jgi:hypothetical protein